MQKIIFQYTLKRVENAGEKVYAFLHKLFIFFW